MLQRSFGEYCLAEDGVCSVTCRRAEADAVVPG
jgi:hypothetical protein